MEVEVSTDVTNHKILSHAMGKKGASRLIYSYLFSSNKKTRIRD